MGSRDTNLSNNFRIHLKKKLLHAQVSSTISPFMTSNRLSSWCHSCITLVLLEPHLEYMASTVLCRACQGSKAPHHFIRRSSPAWNIRMSCQQQQAIAQDLLVRWVVPCVWTAVCRHWPGSTCTRCNVSTNRHTPVQASWCDSGRGMGVLLPLSAHQLLRTAPVRAEAGGISHFDCQVHHLEDGHSKQFLSCGTGGCGCPLHFVCETEERQGVGGPWTMAQPFGNHQTNLQSSSPNTTRLVLPGGIRMGCSNGVRSGKQEGHCAWLTH